MIASLLLIPMLLVSPQGEGGGARSGVSDRDLGKMSKDVNAFFEALDEDQRKDGLEALEKLESALEKAAKKAKPDKSMLAYIGDWSYLLETSKAPDRSLTSDFGKGFFRHVFADPWDADERRVVSMMSVPSGVKGGEILPVVVCLKPELGLAGKDLDEAVASAADAAFGTLVDTHIILIPIGLETGSGRKAKTQEVDGSWSADNGMYVFFTAYRTLLEQLPFDSTRVVLDGWGEAGVDALQLASTTPFFAGLLLRSSPMGSADTLYGNLASVPVLYIKGAADGGPDSLEALTDADGVTVEVVEVEGASQVLSADSVAKVLEWTGACRRDPTPGEFEYKLGDVRFGSVNWCTAMEINRRVTAKPGDPDFPRIKVDVNKGSNTIEIDAVNVLELFVYLSDGIVDLDKPVTITVNGVEKVKKKTYRRSLRHLLETRFYNNSGDYGLYTASERIEDIDANLPGDD